MGLLTTSVASERLVTSVLKAPILHPLDCGADYASCSPGRYQTTAIHYTVTLTAYMVGGDFS